LKAQIFIIADFFISLFLVSRSSHQNGGASNWSSASSGTIMPNPADLAVSLFLLTESSSIATPTL
jgi:hypothetical protein